MSRLRPRRSRRPSRAEVAAAKEAYGDPVSPKAWRGEFYGILKGVAGLGDGRKLHGDAWADKMEAYYARRAKRLLQHVPPECRAELLELGERLTKLVQ